MRTLKYIAFALLAMGLTTNVQGQLNPMGSIYFQNQYLINPAMAGVEKGWEINGAYKAQWTAIDGAPAMQSLTLTHGAENKKVGIGFLLYNDNAGIVQTTGFKGTYAYHLQFNNEESRLDFGLSAGILNEWVDWGKVIGDEGDITINNFNDRKLYLDADFGLALRVKSLTLQGSLPNLKRFWDRDIQRNVVDKTLFMAAAGYKIEREGAELTSIEPKVMFRKVDNFKDILDAGVNLQFRGDKLMLSGMYHNSNSITFGAGTTYQSKLAILAQYTTNTADLQGYSNGEFEIAVKYNFR